MTDITIVTAFIGGLLSFASPCVLPLIPAYISYIVGISLADLQTQKLERAEYARVILSMLFFIAGFSVVFVSLGMAATKLGQLLYEHMQIFQRVAGIIIVIFGLHLVGLIKIKFLLMEKKIQLRSRWQLLTAFLLGFAFAFGWTPCVGPILAGILALAAQAKTVTRGGFLLAVYSLGLAVPFFLSGLAVNRLILVIKKYGRYLRWVEIASGILLIALGILIFFNILQKIVNWIY